MHGLPSISWVIKSRQRSILILGLSILLFLVACQFVPFTPNEADVNEAKQVVLRHTSEGVLGIEIQDNGSIVVKTGWIKGSLNGDGNSYWLRRDFGVWWIYKKAHWTI